LYKTSHIRWKLLKFQRTLPGPLFMTHSHEVHDGRAVYIYAYDIAYEINLEQVGFLLSKPLQEYAIGPSKRSPKYYFFYRPKFCRLSEKCLLQGPPVMLYWDGKVFRVGAISIEVSLPFEGVSLHELVGYHDPVFDDNMSLEMKVRKQAELMLAELRPMCVNPVDAIGQSEAYTVFCLNRLSDNRKAEGGSKKTSVLWRHCLWRRMIRNCCRIRRSLRRLAGMPVILKRMWWWWTGTQPW
jgi:hypothetical protein